MVQGTQELFDSGERSLKAGDWDNASKVFEEIIKILEGQELDEEGKRSLAEALRKRGFADSRIGEVGRALVQARKALEISSSINDVIGEADALRRLGYVHWQKGDIQMAEEFYSNALQKALDSGSKDLEGKVRIEIGNVMNQRGELELAKEEYQRAITILKEVGNMNELARAYNNLGDCYIRCEELEEAITVLRHCMDIGTEIGDLTIKGWAAFNAANCFTKMKDTKIAKEYLDLALEVLEMSDDRIGIANTLTIYGQTFTAEREWVMAEDAFNKSYAIATELDLPGLEGGVLLAKAKMFVSRGEVAVAMDLLDRAIKLFGDGKKEIEAEEARKILNALKET